MTFRLTYATMFNPPEESLQFLFPSLQASAAPPRHLKGIPVPGPTSSRVSYSPGRK